MTWREFFNKTLINYKFGQKKTDSVFILLLFCSVLTKESRQIILRLDPALTWKRVSHYQYPGLIPLDLNANFNEHVDRLYSKISSRLSDLRSMRKHLTADAANKV